MERSTTKNFFTFSTKLNLTPKEAKEVSENKDLLSKILLAKLITYKSENSQKFNAYISTLIYEFLNRNSYNISTIYDIMLLNIFENHLSFSTEKSKQIDDSVKMCKILDSSSAYLREERYKAEIFSQIWNKAQKFYQRKLF